MENEFKNLQRQWENDQKEVGNRSLDMNQIVRKIGGKKRENRYFYYGTFFILTITLVGISLFFYHVAPVKETISRIGVGFMIVALLVRIMIEIGSTLKVKKIDLLDDALKVRDSTINFYNYRKKIHGAVTLMIVGAYTVGFYMITPEFSLYISFWKMVLIDVSYVVIAVILVVHIRNGIKKEMRTLRDIVQLRNDLLEQ